MNVIIIGLGSMGKAHLNAIINIKIIKKIYIYDIDQKKLLNLKEINRNKIQILSSLKKKNNYQLAIIASNSYERLKILKELVKFNRVKNILLEKFPFAKVNDFKLFQNQINESFKGRIDINTWGQYIANIIKLKFKPTNIIIQTNSKNFLSNFIHFADIFLFYNKKEKYLIDISKLKKKIFQNTRKNYSEKRGKILINSNVLNLEYLYNHKLKNGFEIILKNKEQQNLRIVQDRNMKLKIIDNKVKIVDFPVARILTKKYFYETLKSRSFKDFSSTKILKFSEIFLKKINKLKLKNFYIT